MRERKLEPLQLFKPHKSWLTDTKPHDLHQATGLAGHALDRLEAASSLAESAEEFTEYLVSARDALEAALVYAKNLCRK